jgi:hypothetical protein
MPPAYCRTDIVGITGVLPLLAVSTCLLLSCRIFLAVYAVKAITENGKSKSEVRRLSASSDAIILVAMAGPLAFASKHCAAYGKSRGGNRCFSRRKSRVLRRTPLPVEPDRNEDSH